MGGHVHTADVCLAAVQRDRALAAGALAGSTTCCCLRELMTGSAAAFATLGTSTDDAV